ncbi:MAG TPA: CBS domain-containing protein, partial [Gammaproteobacteria bacterium]
MNRPFRPLTVTLAPANTRLAHPAQDFPQHVRLESPAIDVMTDLSRAATVSVAADATLEQAEQRMKYSGVRLLFVIDASGMLLGLVTLNDIKGERPMRYQGEMNVSYGDIQVQNVMTPLNLLETLSMHEVADSCVGDVVATLKQTGRQHALVVERSVDAYRVRGIFSARQIGRQLGVPIHTAGIA